MIQHLPTITLGFVAIVFIAVITILPDDKSKFYAVIFNPDVETSKAITHILENDARLVRKAAFENIYIVYSEVPSFSKNIKDEKVLFSFDALVSGGCIFRKKNKNLVEVNSYANDI